MRDETIARNYAEALFELAERHEGVEVYGTGVETLARLIDENDDFRRFLETPRIAVGAERKRWYVGCSVRRYPRNSSIS